jgi:hypothetical protein
VTIIMPHDVPVGATLRDTNRELFPVEKAHGTGIYDRLRLLPDLPLRKSARWGDLSRINSSPA